MVVPQWLKPYIQDKELADLELAIHMAEQKTEAEIVPIIVRSSSNYRQAEITLMLLGFIFFLLAYEVLNFEAYWDSFIKGAVFVGAGLLVIFGVFPRLSHWPRLQTWLTIRAEELEQVNKRAEIEFFENGVHETADRIGVMIYISLVEHCVVVLADKTVTEKFPADTWQKAVDQVLAGIREKNMAGGLKTAIGTLSDLLATAFPVKSANKNELSNHLIIKE